MTVLIMALFAIELVAYFVLLSRLANVTKTKRPALFGLVGGVPTSDYLMMGFGPSDSFVSKLESHRNEVANEPEILRLMKAVRIAYVALVATFCIGFIVIIAHAD